MRVSVAIAAAGIFLVAPGCTDGADGGVAGAGGDGASSGGSSKGLGGEAPGTGGASAAAEAAAKEVVRAKAHRALADVEAPYIAEMVRLEVVRRFGEKPQGLSGLACQCVGRRNSTSEEGDQE